MLKKANLNNFKKQVVGNVLVFASRHTIRIGCVIAHGCLYKYSFSIQNTLTMSLPIQIVRFQQKSITFKLFMLNCNEVVLFWEILFRKQIISSLYEHPISFIGEKNWALVYSEILELRQHF